MLGWSVPHGRTWYPHLQDKLRLKEQNKLPESPAGRGTTQAPPVLARG